MAREKDDEMARETGDEARMTLYRLVGLSSIDDAIREKYREPEDDRYRYFHKIVSVGDTKAVLYWGTVESDRASWTTTVIGLTKENLKVGSTTSSAVLVIPHAGADDEVPDGEADNNDSESDGSEASHFAAWAITFGMGFQMLEKRYIDTGFGQRVAIRCAKPEGLNVLSKTTLDERPRMVRSTIPSGGDPRRFGFRELEDFSTGLVVEGCIEGIGDVKVKGGDSLNIPLSTSPTALLNNLKQIKTILDKKSESSELAALENLSLVKNTKEIKRLNQHLIEAIGGKSGQVEASKDGNGQVEATEDGNDQVEATEDGNGQVEATEDGNDQVEASEDGNGQVALSYPYEILDEFGQFSCFKVIGIRLRKKHDYLPAIDDLLDPIRKGKDEEQRLKRLDRLSVGLYQSSNDKETAILEIPIKKWLTFQTTSEHKRYSLQNGHWYVMGDDYVKNVEKQVKKIFNRKAHLGRFPNWPICEKPNDKDAQKKANAELAYNKRIAKKLNGLCLDQQLIWPKKGKSGIEACDVLLPKGVFVHVKHIPSSSQASHLLAQALVATDLLLADKEAQEQLKSLIDKVAKSAHLDPKNYMAKPRQVVIVMAKDDKKITAEDLFTFTKINLIRHDQRLASMNVELNVVPVVRKKKQSR